MGKETGKKWRNTGKKKWGNILGKNGKNWEEEVGIDAGKTKWERILGEIYYEEEVSIYPGKNNWEHIMEKKVGKYAGKRKWEQVLGRRRWNRSVLLHKKIYIYTSWEEERVKLIR